MPKIYMNPEVLGLICLNLYSSVNNQKSLGLLSEKCLLPLWTKLLFIFPVFIYSSLPILSQDPIRRAHHFLGSMIAQNPLGFGAVIDPKILVWA